MGVFKFSWEDFMLTLVGLAFLLLDIVLDIWTAVTFYQEKSYWCLGFLVLFLLGSSVLVQAFSWLWYSYDDREEDKKKCPNECQLKLLHFLQLGIYLRHAGVVQATFCKSGGKGRDPKDTAVFLSHDLSLLRMVEMFSESAPQLVLMVTVYLQQGHFDPVTALKALWSGVVIAFGVTMYHRSLRAFLTNKKQQRRSSSLVYLIWNALLILSRVSALALFASVLPCFIVTHFICSWMVLLFCVWRADTDFMDSAFGEWIYRGTVGLIWYFNWFNVVDRSTRNMTLLYHGYILTDIVLLCGLWAWKMSTEPPFHEISYPYTLIIPACVVAVNLLGLLCKTMYYKLFHPNVTKKELRDDVIDQVDNRIQRGGDISQTVLMGEDLETNVADRSLPSGPSSPSSPPVVKHTNKRMKKMAENFYS